MKNSVQKKNHVKIEGIEDKTNAEIMNVPTSDSDFSSSKKTKAMSENNPQKLPIRSAD